MNYKNGVKCAPYYIALKCINCDCEIAALKYIKYWKLKNNKNENE